MLRLKMLSVLCVSLFFAATVGADGDKKEKGPLELTLVAKKDSYKLDLGKMTADDMKKLLQDRDKAGQWPKPPEVDLVLEVKNTSGKDIEVCTTGDPIKYQLVLEGPEAVNQNLGRMMTMDFRMPKAETIKAGDIHTIKISRLEYGTRNVSEGSFWLKPGEYTLTAKYITAVKPAPKDTKEFPHMKGFGALTLTSNSVKIKVEK